MIFETKLFILRIPRSTKIPSQKRLSKKKKIPRPPRKESSYAPAPRTKIPISKFSTIRHTKRKTQNPHWHQKLTQINLRNQLLWRKNPQNQLMRRKNPRKHRTNKWETWRLSLPRRQQPLQQSPSRLWRHHWEGNSWLLHHQRVMIVMITARLMKMGRSWLRPNLHLLPRKVSPLHF